MTVSAQTRFNEYAGAGTTGPFPYTFRITAATDLVCKVTSAAGAVTTVTPSAVTGAGDANGGSVTLGTALATGETLLIYSSVPLTQSTDYIAGDSFPAETHEAALDRLTMIAQDGRRDIDRSFKVPIGSTAPAETDDIVQAVADLVTDEALVSALEAAGEEQIGLVNAAGAAQLDAIAAALDPSLAEIDEAGEAQVAIIEAAGAANTANYFATDAAGLTAAASDGYFGVVQTYGKGIDWKIDNAGSALFKGFGAGPLGGEVRAIRLQQLSSRACTQFPAGWEVWWAMDAALTDWAYIPYRTPRVDYGAYRLPFNTFGFGDLRDETAGNPTITPFAVDGPLGEDTAATVVFSSTSSVLGNLNTETFKPPNGTPIIGRVVAVTASGTGSKNYRFGQAGTVDVTYKVLAIPDISGEDFTDPTNADISFTFSLTYDSSKQLGFWPDTNGDAATLHICSIEWVRADSALPALADRQWGGFVSRGSASRGGVVLDAEYCFDNGGLSDPGLIDFPPNWPEATDYSTGKTEIVLGEFIGGAGSSSYAVMSSEDFNNDLTPTTNSNTFGLLFNNTTEEGQFAPYPNYSLGRHAANGIGMGLVPWWNRIGPDKHDYGVGGGILYDMAPSFTAWSGRQERIAAYNGSRDITQLLTTNHMRIAAKARRRGRATDSELAQAIRAMQEQAAVAGMTLGNYTDWLGLIGDSNDDRNSGSGGSWPFRISAGGFMGVGYQNAVISVRAVGGKGLYGVGLFSIDTATGFTSMLESLKPGIELALELGLKPGILFRGGTNDYDEINADVDRVDEEYTQYIRDPVLAEGAHLLTADILPCQSRFTEAKNLEFRALQVAYAASKPGQVWHLDSGNTGLWDVDNQASYFASEASAYVHLDPATGDPEIAAQYRDNLINPWRDERD